VEQRFYSASEDDKRRVIRQILRQRELSQAIVFVNSKLGAARLARSFERDGLRTAALHGDKSQDERLKSLAAFKAGEVDLLVATDVAARGLDIADLPAVFNFDVPFTAEDYVHRIGRTGRAGASGLAVTLVDRDDNRLVADIEKLIKKKLEIEPFELEDDRPRRNRYRDDEDEPLASVARPERVDAVASVPSERPPRDRAPRDAYRPRSAPSDPFFDKPYEPSGSGDASWDKAAAAPSAARSPLSPNIRPKKRVASLLGGKV
jgi:superfamily II DNA/RNA helicase